MGTHFAVNGTGQVLKNNHLKMCPRSHCGGQLLDDGEGSLQCTLCSHTFDGWGNPTGQLSVEEIKELFKHSGHHQKY